MAWAPQWPNGLDTYGSFPGQPFTDGSEYILAAYADSWVLAIANLEAFIGYGSGAASPTYSPVFGQNFGTIAARLVNVETVANNASGSVSGVTPIGGIIEWANDNAPPSNYLYLHGQTVTNGASTYPVLAATYPGWVSGSNLVMPDTRNRLTVGAGSTYESGQTAGSSSVTLTVLNIPQFLNQNVDVTASVSGGSISGSFSGEVSGGTVSGGTVTGSVTGSASGNVSINEPTEGGGAGHYHLAYINEIGTSGQLVYTDPSSTGNVYAIPQTGQAGSGPLLVSNASYLHTQVASSAVTASFSSGSISGSISGGSLSGASLSGATVSGGTVSGSLSGADVIASGTVTFGQASPQGVSILPPVIAFHKIVRAA